MITILLVDDHRIMRAGLHALISEQEDMKVTGEAGDGREAVRLAARLKPQVIIMDLSMPGLNGIDATRQILSDNPAARIIALSMHTEQRLVTEMIRAGAAGYLLKDCAIDEVIEAIRTVAGNRSFLSRKISDLVLKDYALRLPEGGTSLLDPLTQREREVLQLIAEGKRTREIADLLALSIKTIEHHRQQIMIKLNVESVAELTKVAIREGLTSI